MKSRLLLIFLCLPFLSVAQHELSGTFTPAVYYKWGILYEVTPTGTEYVRDTQFDRGGKFSIPLDSAMTHGVYRFVYGLPPESHNFELIYNGNESIELTYSHKNGLSFIKSEENKRWESYKEIMSVLRQGVNDELNQEDRDEKVLDSLFKRQESMYYLYKNSSRGKLVEKYIEAVSPYIPEDRSNLASYRSERADHLLNTLSFEDTILQRSAILLDRTLEYLSSSPDHYEQNLNKIVIKLLPCDREFKKSFMLRVWTRLQESKRENEANYFASAHLIPLATRMKDMALVRELETIVNTSIGAKAPNFSWKDMADNSRNLHDLNNAEQYILVFWSSTCSHCLIELPKLQNEVRFLPKGEFLVVAFGLEDDIYNWRNEILRLPEFLHVPGLGKWENETGNAYNVQKTPTYFVLNSEKIITAKPESLEELVEIIKD